MFLSFLVFAHLSVLCVGSARIGYDFYPELKGWLKVNHEPTDWSTARSTCHSEDALLASPWSPEFASTISKIQSTKYVSLLPVLYSGAGLRADSPGVPMEACGNKRCRVFRADGTMDKVECNQRLPYACYAPENTCSGNGYELKSENGECYKLHDDRATFQQARRICTNEDAFLAVISDPVEKALLKAISSGTMAFIENDNDGPAYRHISASGYSDYPCKGAHRFICEKVTPSSVVSDLRD